MGEMRQKSKVAAKDRGEQMRTDNGSEVLEGACVPYWNPQPTGEQGLPGQGCGQSRQRASLDANGPSARLRLVGRFYKFVLRKVLALTANP